MQLTKAFVAETSCNHCYWFCYVFAHDQLAQNCKSFGEKVRFISLRFTTSLQELWKAEMYPKGVAVEVMRWHAINWQTIIYWLVQLKTQLWPLRTFCTVHQCWRLFKHKHLTSMAMPSCKSCRMHYMAMTSLKDCCIMYWTGEIQGSGYACMSVSSFMTSV